MYWYIKVSKMSPIWGTKQVKERGVIYTISWVKIVKITTYIVMLKNIWPDDVISLEW
jgi:hypothetical protein